MTEEAISPVQYFTLSMGELHDTVCFDTKDGIKYMEIYLVETLVSSDNESSAAGLFFFEVPVPDSSTAFGFISGIFSKTSKSSSSSSEPVIHQKCWVFFFRRSYFDLRPFIFSLQFSAEKL